MPKYASSSIWLPWYARVGWYADKWQIRKSWSLPKRTSVLFWNFFLCCVGGGHWAGYLGQTLVQSFATMMALLEEKVLPILLRSLLFYFRPKTTWPRLVACETWFYLFSASDGLLYGVLKLFLWPFLALFLILAGYFQQHMPQIIGLKRQQR